jgi:hypothetical protein
VQRVAPEQASCQRFMNMGLDRSGAIEGLPETNKSSIGANANPQDVVELVESQGFKGDDLHQ